MKYKFEALYINVTLKISIEMMFNNKKKKKIYVFTYLNVNL